MTLADIATLIGLVIALGGLIWNAAKMSVVVRQVNGLPTKHAVLENKVEDVERRISNVELHVLKQ